MAIIRRQTPRAQAFDLPIIGDDLSKVGRIIDIYASPCQPSVEIWVYGFWSAIPTLFLSIAKPEIIDVNIHKGRHRNRKGKRLRFRATKYFRDAFVQVPVPSWKVFRIYEFGQRIGYFFLVADALENFAINWMSTAYMWTGCEGPIAPYALREAPDTLQGAGPEWDSVIFDTLGVNQMEVNATMVRANVGGEYRVSWQSSFRPYAVPEQATIPTEDALWVKQPGLPEELFEQSINVSTGEDARASSGSVLAGSVLPGTEFRIKVRANKSGFYHNKTDLNINRVTDTGIAPDP